MTNGSRKAMASKQQEVEVIESWEDIEEIDVLDKKLNNLIMPSKSLEDSSNSIDRPVKIVLTGEDALRSQYVPPEPSVKILKRPSNNAQNGGDSKVFQPKKTLQQREQEYAEARLRILGEAKPENVEITKICIQRPRTEVDIIRMPRGPDGTNGFKVRR